MAAGQELMRITLDSLHPESSDNEIDEIIEANFVEGQIRLNNRSCYKVREQLYV